MILKAIILGIVEGITEFLPVSSTGHLIIVNKYINFTGNFANTFDIVIQVGAILAVLIYFRNKIFPRFNNPIEIKKVSKLWLKVFIGFIPAAMIGLIFNDFIEKYLFNQKSVAIALITGALLMFFIEFKHKSIRVASEHEISYLDALVVGIAQCVSLWPGMSRSAATMIGGMFIGFSREVAAEFSFFLAIPTLLGASVYKLFKSGFGFGFHEYLLLFIGTLVSFIVAFLVISMFMNYIKKRNLSIFAYYRIILGILVLLIV